MGKYLAPLGIFCGGMLLALVLFLFLGTIGDAADKLGEDTAAMAPVFWNWTWVAQGSVVKFIVFIVVILLTLYATAKAFLRVR